LSKINNYSETGLEKIESVSIFSKEDVEIIKDMQGELQRVFKVKQVFRTETEMRYSVLDDVRFPTVASKYWQSIREQSQVFENVVNACFDFESLSANIELMELDLQEIDTSNKRGKILSRKKQAEIKRAEFNLEGMKVTANDQVREIKLWEKLKNELREIDDSFDINDVNSHQYKSLKAKWTNQKMIADMYGNASLGKVSAIGLKTMQESVIGKNQKSLIDKNDKLVKNVIQY
jgi:hypothetical protein